MGLQIIVEKKQRKVNKVKTKERTKGNHCGTMFESLLCHPVRLMSKRVQGGNPVWMPVNVPKVDVLFSPSLMTICGLGQ